MSTTILAGIVLIGGFFLLMMIKVPVTFSMLISTFLSMLLVPGTNPTTIIRMMFDGVSNFTMLAIPFFIVMGEIMAVGEISDKIVDLANLAVGRFRGGLAYVNCLDSMFFGGISGSAVADVSSLGSVVIPMMEKQGYDREFTVGLTVTTACQGVLIPPSHNMVIYALAAGGGVSIGQLFYAGFVPGIALGCGFIIMCMLLGKKYNFPKGEKMFKNDKIRWISFHKSQGGFYAHKNPDSWFSLGTPAFELEMGKAMRVLCRAGWGTRRRVHPWHGGPGSSALASSCLFILWKSVSALLTEPLIQAFLDLVPDVPQEDPARRVPDADPGHVWKRNIGGTGRLPATGTEKV